MCGICGFIGGEQKTEVLKSMMEAIRHRGPDKMEYLKEMAFLWDFADCLSLI